MRWTNAWLASPLALALLAQPQGPVAVHAYQLQQIRGLDVTLRLSQGGTVLETHRLVIQRPLLARWDSERSLVVSDGQQIYRLDKLNQTFTRQPATAESLATIMAGDPVWPYAAFFDPKWQDAITQQRMGAQFERDGLSFQQVVLTRSTGITTVLFDTGLGLARGGSFSRGGRLVAVDVSELKVNASPPVGTFAWVRPAGAKEVAFTPEVKPMRYADIQPILARSCTSCHGGRNPARGLDLSSYSAILASGSVRPGNPGESSLGRSVTRGVMPPNGPLPADEIDRLNRWIADGAKE